MSEESILRQEIADTRKTISKLEEEIRTIQGFIAADERNIQHPVEAVRTNARLSLDNYRNSLALKQTELQSLQIEQQTRQSVLTKIEELKKKEKEVQELEQNRDRIIALHEKARSDLERIRGELQTLQQPAPAQDADLIFADGKRLSLNSDGRDLPVGCEDPADGIYPDVDLTPFGGTTSGVSRRHATITFRNGQWVITDQNSTNGTFVNETRIAAHIPKVLQNQANLRFGTIVARFALRSVPNPAMKTTRLS